MVVQDIFDPMESMHFADLFLPAAQWGEKTGTYTCSERRVNLGQQAVQPVGYELRPTYGAYSDLDIIKMVADKLASFDARFRDQAGQSLVKSADPETVFNEWKQVSAGKICDMSGMTYANLASQQRHCLAVDAGQCPRRQAPVHQRPVQHQLGPRAVRQDPDRRRGSTRTA